jgi:hypothetical protein
VANVIGFVSFFCSKDLEVISSIIISLAKVSFLLTFFYVLKLPFSLLGLKIEER